MNMTENKMSAPINDGGAAFPSVSATGYVENGMTLRDYFAAKALNGLVSSPDHGCDKFANLARDAYRLADAMIAARGGAK